MVLSGSGQLSFNQIQIELGRTTGQANFSLASASLGLYAAINTGNPVNDRPDQVAPHAVTEWYSYDHNFASITYSIDLSYSTGNGGFTLDADAPVAVSFEVASSLTVDGYTAAGCSTYSGDSTTLAGGNLTLASGSQQVIVAGDNEDNMSADSSYYKFTVGSTLSVSINGGAGTSRTNGVQWAEGGYNWIFNFNSNCTLNQL